GLYTSRQANTSTNRNSFSRNAVISQAHYQWINLKGFEGCSSTVSNFNLEQSRNCALKLSRYRFECKQSKVTNFRLDSALHASEGLVQARLYEYMAASHTHCLGHISASWEASLRAILIIPKAKLSMSYFGTF